jgi:polysaccharide biosynthesis/export protein
LPLCRTLICAGFLVLTLSACATLPLGREVIEQAHSGGRIAFDVVDVNDSVLTTLLAHQAPPFEERFKKYLPPPDFAIAAGDTVSVVIWEAGPNGLFGNSLTQLSIPAGAAAELRTGQVPNLGSVSPLPSGLTPAPDLLESLFGLAEPSSPTATPTTPNFAAAVAQIQRLLAVTNQAGQPGTEIPDQQVGIDGGISIPYAGRIDVAGRTPRAVEHLIEKRLGPIALDPQVLVMVKESAANSVAVAGDVVAGKRVPLSPGGDRLLQVIAAVGGSKAPVRDTYVQLSRGGVTATVPLATLVADPAQNIFAKPGDVLTLERRPQTFSVFGATGQNTAITFSRDRLSLSEALARAGGLLDERADPRAVFLFRYEPVSILRALGQPIATGARDGLSPVVYRLDLKKAQSYLLARRFPVHDKDVIFVADAPSQRIYYFFQALQNITGPVVSGLVTCQYASC